MAAWTILLCVLVLTDIASSDEAEIMFVLDASGSMLARDPSGERKITEAKKIIRETVTNLSPGVTASLATFGHRRAGDCSDIEIMIPPNTKD